MRILIFLLLSTSLHAQILDSAKAYQNTYASWERKCYGRMTNGHYYFAGFINHYDTAGVITNLEAFRVDMNTREVIYKTLPSLSSQSVLWVWLMDSAGHVWASLSADVRRMYEFNFKDSIWYVDHGGLPDGNGLESNELAYSMAMCTDGNIVIGTSSSRPMIMYYNRLTGQMVSFGTVDPQQDYILSCSGDANYLYSQVGQKNKIYLYATSKTTGVHTKIDSIGTNSRFNLRARNDGFVYYSNAVGNYRLTGATSTQVTTFGGTKYIDYYEVGDVGQMRVTSNNFDLTTNELSYATSTGITGTVEINAQNIQANIGYSFVNNRDTNWIYYQGKYYGAIYRSNVNTGQTQVIGKGIGNIYSSAQVSSHEIALGGYPSGLTVIYDLDSFWNVGVYDTATKVVGPLTKTSNPRFVCNMKTFGGFHHVYGMVYDSVNNLLIGSGDVDRIGDGASAVVHNFDKDSTYGYDYNKIPTSCNFRDIVLNGNEVLLSFTGTNGRVYRYDHINNVMKDSIVKPGVTNFGKLYPVGEMLLMIANARYMKMNLARSKDFLYDSTVVGTNYFHGMACDGRLIVNGWNPPPANFWPFKYLGNFPDRVDYVGMVGSRYSPYGKNIYRTVNVCKEVINIAPAIGKEQFVDRKLNGWRE